MPHMVRDGAYRLFGVVFAIPLFAALALAFSPASAADAVVRDAVIADIQFDAPVDGSFYGERLKLPKPRDVTVVPGEGSVELGYNGKTAIICFIMPPEDLTPENNLFSLQKNDLAKEVAGGEYGKLVLNIVETDVRMRVEGLPSIVQNTDATMFAATELVADNPPPNPTEPLPHLDVIHGYFIANGASFQFVAVTSRDGYRESGRALFATWLNRLVETNVKVPDAGNELVDPGKVQ